MTTTPTNISAEVDVEQNTVTITAEFTDAPPVQIVLDNAAAWKLGDLLHDTSIALDDYQAGTNCRSKAEPTILAGATDDYPWDLVGTSELGSELQKLADRQPQGPTRDLANIVQEYVNRIMHAHNALAGRVEQQQRNQTVAERQNRP